MQEFPDGPYRWRMLHMAESIEIFDGFSLLQVGLIAGSEGPSQPQGESLRPVSKQEEKTGTISTLRILHWGEAGSVVPSATRKQLQLQYPGKKPSSEWQCHEKLGSQECGPETAGSDAAASCYSS
ncbi:hypothetical protein NQZ68_004643 [Dissostichus eleginoides]|nr:hypothetical protein NQZ68_004643 [Dissostichus eleginoides]